MKAAIINVTGYAGVELARILQRHPEVELTQVTGRGAVGQKLGEAFPHLGDIDLVIENEVTESVDIVFSALPQTASAEALIPILESGVKAVDISADFRLKDASEYEEWYGVPHPRSSLLEESVYGLTELNRGDISESSLIANPGCYPTGAILALTPAIQAGIINEDVIIDSKSGVSGAGRGLSLNTHYSEVNENVSAYSVSGHRHLPEITQELGRVRPDFQPRVTFLPHLIPMTRGILATSYASIKQDFLSSNEKITEGVMEIYSDAYQDEEFVKVTTSAPMTKQTLGGNDCLVHPTVDKRNGRLVMVSCIDNLVKGAAGQAVQNMNIMCGIQENAGLHQLALYP